MARIRVPSASRRAVAARYGGNLPVECDYCGAPGRIHWATQSWVSFHGLELDHLHPTFEGGTSHPDNLTLACASCNRCKGHRTLDKWYEWMNSDRGQRSPIGRRVLARIIAGPVT